MTTSESTHNSLKEEGERLKEILHQIEKERLEFEIEKKRLESKRKEGSQKFFGNGSKKRKTKKTPNAMVVVERTRKRVFRHVRPNLIPHDSLVKKYDGLWLHVLGLNLMGNLWPISQPIFEENKLPTDLYMAKHCAAEVEEVYGISMPLSEKIKLGILVGICIAILVVIFLMAAQGGAK